MKNRICTILCLLTLLGIATLFVQQQCHPFKTKPLQGFTPVVEKPMLSLGGFVSGSYQNDVEQYISDHFGFRELFIRVYNQFTYTCFRKNTNDNIVFGDNGELFLKMYIDEVTGKTFKGCYNSEEFFKEEAQKNIEKTLVLIDSLKKHNTAFLFVEAPSKTWVFPEYLPQRYRDSIMPFCVQDYYTQLFEENNIPHIDFLSYFKSLKGKTEYPLFSRYGTHWSESTIPFVADSILRKIESLIGKELPHIICLDTNLQAHYSTRDGELENLMNLMFPLKKPALPQPVIALSDTILRKPNLLVIADSYFIQLHESCFLDAFNHCEYWKYNDEVFNKRTYLGQVSQNIMAYKTIHEADLVMVINTAPYAYDYMFGFYETAMDAFLDRDHKRMEKRIEETIEYIKKTPEWYESIKKIAEEEHKDLDSLLRGNAIYAIWVDEQREQEQEQE